MNYSQMILEKNIHDNAAVLTKISGKVGMMVDCEIEVSAITWKINAGARCTFITKKKIQKHFA